MADEQKNPSQNEDADKHKTWTSGENPMTEMSDEERKKYLGYVPGPGEPSLEERERQSKQNAQESESGED